MIEVQNGNVVVIRDGDYVQCIFYRKYYSSAETFFAEIRYYLEEHRFDDTNIGYMKIEDNRFVPPTDKRFIAEFASLLAEFDIPSNPYCECGTPVFAYLYDTKTYCPRCRRFFDEEPSDQA